MSPTKPFLLVFLFLIGGTLCQDEEPADMNEQTTVSPEDNSPPCARTGWNFENLSCLDLLPFELYRDVDGQQSNRICCNPEHENFKQWRNLPYMCRTTTCQPSNTQDVCSSLDSRFIKNGTIQLQYEEILQESCALEGGQGTTGLCCVTNSTEGLLATTLGAEPNEFPHQAKLRLPGHCGGTIYNSRFIITAAHCIVETESGEVQDMDGIEVILGSNIGDMEASEYIYKVKRLIPHPHYSRLKTNPEFQKEYSRIFNDIALMELDRDIKFGPKVKALEIAPKRFNALQYADNAIIVGWGTTDTLDVSVHLQKANFLIRRDQSCFMNPQGPHAEMTGMENQLLCVGGILEGKWSATAGAGDSGGPAVCRGPDGRALLCGVTSFGGDDELCSQNDDEENCPPSVYAEVAHFHGWIKELAGEQDKSTLYQPFVYGETIELSDHEHQVHITSVDGKSCGGTLIAPDVVVTAAQCAVKLDGSGDSLGNIVITTGLDDVSGQGKDYQIKGIATLPGFEMVGDPILPENQGNRLIISDNYHKNDLVVIKLAEATDISLDKLPKLPAEGALSTIGMEMSFPRNTTYTGKMRRYEFNILDKDDCQIRMNRMSRAGMNLTIDDNVLCGVETYSGGSMCDRELGGGLICKSESGDDVLCGIQIFRLCELSIPNGFIDMSLYTDWIRKAMEQL